MLSSDAAPLRGSVQTAGRANSRRCCYTESDRAMPLGIDAVSRTQSESVLQQGASACSKHSSVLAEKQKVVVFKRPDVLDARNVLSYALKQPAALHSLLLVHGDIGQPARSMRCRCLGKHILVLLKRGGQPHDMAPCSNLLAPEHWLYQAAHGHGCVDPNGVRLSKEPPDQLL